nr:MAG TPA: hypothetical protein [Caudoviricetes sp.]
MHATTHKELTVDGIHRTPHALLPNTNHHRYSTMTQPCHKDTTLNQQCCDREHKRWRGRIRDRYNRSHETTHTPQRDSVAQHSTTETT